MAIASAPAPRGDGSRGPVARYRRGYLTGSVALIAIGAVVALVTWWRDVLAGRWPALSQDTFLYYVPNVLYLRDSLRRGFGLLWNGQQNCGQPAFGNGQIPALDPTAWLFALLEPPAALAAVNTLALWLGALGVVALARSLRLHPVAAFCGGLAFMTAGRTAQLGLWQPTWLVPYMWMPWVLACAERILRRPDYVGVVSLAGVLTLQLFAGSPQLSLFTYELLAARCLWELLTRWRRGARPGVLAVALAAALPVGLAAVKLLPAIEMSGLSIRALPLSEADVFGGAPRPTWELFRSQLTSPLSDSAICQPWLLGLALLAPWARTRRRVALGYLAVALLFFALSFDGPVFDLYRALPFGEVFRQPARFRSVTAMLAAALVALGTHGFVAAWRRGGPRLWLAMVAPLLGVMLVHWLSRTPFAGFSMGHAALFAVIGLAAARRRAGGGAARRRWRLAVAAWALIMPALLVVMALLQPAAAPAGPPSHAATLLARERELTELAGAMAVDERAYLFADVETARRRDWSVSPKSASLFGLRGVSDYEPQVTRRFADLLLRLRGGGLYAGFLQFELYPHRPRERAILNLLAARYVVANGAPPLALGGPGPPLVELHRDDGFAILENPAALPRALYVPQAAVVTDPVAILTRLATADHDPRRVALLEAPPADGFLGTPGGVGSATLTADRGEEVRVRVRADAPGFLFLSDQDYPGWSATVNGVATPILRANYAFRLVRVPGGASEVVFRYAPRSLYLGALLSLATVAALVAAALVRRRRRRTP